MVNGVGAAVGEAVTRDVVRSFRALGTPRLQQIRRSGISDQRVSLINQILAERAGAIKVSEQQLVQRLTEVRGVPSVTPSVTPTATERALGISLPAQLRQRPVQEVLRDQSLIQTLRPTPRLPTPTRPERVVGLPPERKGLEGEITRVTGEIRELQGQRRIEKNPAKRSLISSEIIGLRFALTGLQTVRAGTKPRELVIGARETLKQTFKFITGESKESPFAPIGVLARQEPFAFTGAVLGEVAFLKGINLVFAKVPPKVSGQLAKLSPKFKPVKGGIITDIPSAGRLDDAILDIGGSRVDFETATRIKGTNQIRVAGTIKTFTEPLAEQAKLAGQKLPIVVSAQRDLFGTLRRRRIDISKPIPNEELLSIKTKADLLIFREGKLSPNKFADLNKRVILETQGAGGLLETAFFADPRGRLRPSRLGLSEKEASLIDVLSGDVTFKRSKPQALFFEDITVAKFPPALRGIERKLKTGKPLTELEQAKLLKFQLTPTGEFKPIGFLTKEPEILLANGEVIRRVKVEAVTVIDGRRVPIIRTEIIKDAKLSALFKKVGQRKASKAEISRLSKATGIDFSRILSEAKFISPTGLGFSAISKLSKLPKGKGTTLSGLPSISSKTGRRAPSVKFSSISRDISGRRTSRAFSKRITTILSGSTPKKTLRRSPLVPIRRIVTPRRVPPVAPSAAPIVRVPPIIKRIPKKFLGKDLSKSFRDAKSFDILVRKKGKFVRAKKRLPFNRAVQQGAKLIDRNLRATFRLRENPKLPLKKEVPRSKLNPTIFRRPKKNSPLFKPNTLTVIERRNKRLSTRTEVSNIQRLRKVKTGKTLQNKLNKVPKMRKK